MLKQTPVSIKALKKVAEILLPEKKTYGICDDGVFGPIEGENLETKRFCCSAGVHTITHQEFLNKKSYFSYYSPVKLLHFLLPKIYPKFFPPPNEDDSKLRDVRDGSEFQRVSGPNTITLMMGWDGAPIGKNNSNCLWPLVGFLPDVQLEFRSKFVLPIAVYYGKDHPNCHMMDPLVDDLLETLESPMKVTVTENGRSVQKEFKIVLLCAICDSPARNKSMNMKGFQGTFGCCCCPIKTGREKSQKNNSRSRQVYPMESGNALRNDQDWRNIANDIHRGVKKADDETLGIKGLNPYMRLPYVDLPSFSPPEVMHAMFLGNTKRFLKSFLKGMTVYQIGQLNNSLRQYGLPTNVLRYIPEDIKSDKLKSFDYELLLFYCFFLFEPFISDEKYYCFALFAYFISNLCQREIDKNRLDHLDRIKTELMATIKRTFDPTLFTSNMHYIDHYVDIVRKFGPLIPQSSYQVEDIVGQAVKSVQTGTKVQAQLMNKLFAATATMANIHSTKWDEEGKEALGIKEQSFRPIYVKGTKRVTQVTNGKFFYSTESNSSRKKSNDNFVKLKNGRYMTIIEICAEGEVGNEDFTFGGFEIVVSPYQVKQLTFSYLFNGTVNRSAVVPFKFSEILAPFGVYRPDRDTYTVFDLFNRHM